MQIDNKYNIKDKVYIGPDECYVNAIHIMDNGSIEYELWNPCGNVYANYSDWQIQSEPTKIGFNTELG